MKCFGMPMGMWALFAGSFRKQLTDVFGYDTGAAKAVARKARPKYKEVISGLPEFEKADRFKMNIVNAALVASFILSMPERPDLERLTVYYAKSMMTKPMKWFCRKSGKKKFTEKDISSMKALHQSLFLSVKTTQFSNLLIGFSKIFTHISVSSFWESLWGLYPLLTQYSKPPSSQISIKCLIFFFLEN